jgi:hypothetical protein
MIIQFSFKQKVLTENQGKYKNTTLFHSLIQILIADYQLNIDDIEHGILQRSKIKWNPGSLNKFFKSDFEKKFSAEQLENRIHFD